MNESFEDEMDRLVRDDRALSASERRRQPWVPKALAELDAALAEYATRRDEMNQDGLAERRMEVVDEMLERRQRYVRHLEHGDSLDA